MSAPTAAQPCAGTIALPADRNASSKPTAASAFYMIVILVFGYGEEFLRLFMPPAGWHNVLVNWAIRAVLAAYIVTALQCVYAKGWPWSAAATLGLFAAYALFNFCLYRPALFLTVFALT